DRGNGEELDSLQQGAKLVADDSPHPLSHQVSRSRYQKGGEVSVASLRAVVARACAQIVIVGRSVFHPACAYLDGWEQVHVRDRDFFGLHADWVKLTEGLT